MTEDKIEEVRYVLRCNVIDRASTMNADNEIDGWRGNLNLNLAIDDLLDFEVAVGRYRGGQGSGEADLERICATYAVQDHWDTGGKIHHAPDERYLRGYGRRLIDCT